MRFTASKCPISTASRKILGCLAAFWTMISRLASRISWLMPVQRKRSEKLIGSECRTIVLINAGKFIKLISAKIYNFLVFVMEWLSKAGELLDKVRELSGRNNAVK